MGVVVADINHDGRPDVLIANSLDQSMGVLLGNGDGTFGVPLEYDSGGQGANGIAIADVNGDGHPDLLVANWLSNAAGVLLGKGDGTFDAGESYGSGGLYPMSIVAADLNGDAAPDLVLGNECDTGRCDAGRVGVLLHTPVDTTPPAVTVFAAPNVLWPPNGKLVPVAVSGTIVDTGTGVDMTSVGYRVNDEYGSV